MRLLPQGLRYRLLLLFAGASLGLALPFYLYLNQVYGQQLLEERGRALQGMAAAAATVLAENLHERIREIDLLAQAPLYRREDRAELDRSLQALQRSYRHYSWIGFADAEGEVLAASGDLLLGVNVAERPWFAGGARGAYIGDLHEAVLLAKLLPQHEGGGPIRFIDFSAPVRDGEGRLLGVLGAHAHWNWASAVLASLEPLRQSQPELEVLLLDARQKVIYPEHGVRAPAERDLQALRNAAWHLGAEQLSARQAVPALTGVQSLDWQVLVRQPRARVEAEVARLQRLLLLFAAASSSLLVLLLWWIATRISQPIERLAAEAKRIGGGDERPLAPLPLATRELRSLRDAISSMAASLLERKAGLARANAELESRVIERTLELEQANRRLEQLARKDALTGLANRRAAEERLAEEFARWQRSQQGYSLLLLDIDHFKRINDQFGHAVGDSTLQFCALVVRAAVRRTDWLFRIGGEEFLVVLADTPPSEALGVAEKIRALVEASPAPQVGRITLSIGAAGVGLADARPGEALERADQGLYAAKAAGRNCVRAGPEFNTR